MGPLESPRYLAVLNVKSPELFQVTIGFGTGDITGEFAKDVVPWCTVGIKFGIYFEMSDILLMVQKSGKLTS